MDVLEFFESFWRANLDPAAGVVANWASVVSLFAILFTTWRLSKISRFIENEREKIEDLVQPFDLYFEIREAIQVLRQQGHYGIISEDQKDKILEGLMASKSCLELYFREIHDLKGQRDNIFLAAGHRYWDRKKPERALEHYEKATERATDDRELAECLYGLRACYALKKNPHACAIIDKRLNELQEQEYVPASSYMKSGITMVFIYMRSFFRSKNGERQTVLPDTWVTRFGNLRDVPRREKSLPKIPDAGAGGASIERDGKK